MQRFKFTILAICLLLLYLAWGDLEIMLRNPEPKTVSIEELYMDGYPREWLEIQGGYLNLEKAISTSGTIDLDALVVPLMMQPRDDSTIYFLVETRNEELLHHFAQYHFRSHTQEQKDRYLEENRDAFHPQYDIEGLVGTGRVAISNRQKILNIAREGTLDVDEDVVYISEGNTPPRIRGLFFLVVGLLGLVRVTIMWRAPRQAARTSSSS
ncbi:hypothetical protein [Desulfurispira natronophila]|uniref:Uncharacterized protein n=1 Tax=Desulfurispira natronophila TaxID=682562 RepID=A0A7W7Y518_9BACT|nr:hypothetical protein [Desulfurispira natronophila]MBB5022144.1 hypothetical protein [Desulfurispira natronophila]